MKSTFLPILVVCVTAFCSSAPALAAQEPVRVSFDDMQYDGWTILGFQDAVWRAEGGHPGAHLNFFSDNFFIRVFNRTSPDFTGDYTEKGPVEISGDLRWRVIRFGNTDVTRDLFFAIWDEYQDAQGATRWHVVFRPLGKIRGQGPQAPWRTSRVRIPNPNASQLPGGWLYWNFDGAVAPTRELPPGVTWRSILSSVDRVLWTTATPGLFFGFTVFDVSFDNAAIAPLVGSAGKAASADAELSGRFGLDVAGPSPDPDAAASPDGIVDENDLEQFRAWFDAGSLLADVTTTGALEGDWNHGVGDGVVDATDLEAFEAAWWDVVSAN